MPLPELRTRLKEAKADKRAAEKEVRTNQASVERASKAAVRAGNKVNKVNELIEKIEGQIEVATAA